MTWSHLRDELDAEFSVLTWREDDIETALECRGQILRQKLRERRGQSERSRVADPRPGEVFGLWTVLRSGAPDRRWNRRMWCRCACGTESLVVAQALRYGKSRGCPPCRMHGREPAAARYGHWTVLGEGPRRHRMRSVFCRCDCGTEVAVMLYRLRAGNSRGCKLCQGTGAPLLPSVRERLAAKRAVWARRVCEHCGVSIGERHGLARYCGRGCQRAAQAAPQHQRKKNDPAYRARNRDNQRRWRARQKAIA